jgi:uncharacterized ferredoxin-like protein
MIMKIGYKEAEQSAILQTAQLMLAAARTAPKGKGFDNIETYILTAEDKDALIARMREIHEAWGGKGPFARDAHNIEDSECVVLIGVRSKPGGLNCEYCGFPTCADAVKAGARCSFNITDLGIAVGSAASVAMDHRIDNRVIFTGGKAAIEAGYFSEKVQIAYAIPLSTSGKSIYFDRYDPATGRTDEGMK